MTRNETTVLPRPAAGADPLRCPPGRLRVPGTNQSNEQPQTRLSGEVSLHQKPLFLERAGETERPPVNSSWGGSLQSLGQLASPPVLPAGWLAHLQGKEVHQCGSRGVPGDCSPLGRAGRLPLRDARHPRAPLTRHLSPDKLSLAKFSAFQPILPKCSLDSLACLFIPEHSRCLWDHTLSQLWAFQDARPGCKEVTQDSAEQQGLKQGLGEHRGAASKEDFLEEEEEEARTRK